MTEFKFISVGSEDRYVAVAVMSLKRSQIEVEFSLPGIGCGPVGLRDVLQSSLSFKG